MVVQERSLSATGKRSPSNPPAVLLEPEDLGGASDWEVSLGLWDVVLEADGSEDGLELECAVYEGGVAEAEGWAASALALEDAEITPGLRWHFVRR